MEVVEGNANILHQSLIDYSALGIPLCSLYTLVPPSPTTATDDGVAASQASSCVKLLGDSLHPISLERTNTGAAGMAMGRRMERGRQVGNVESPHRNKNKRKRRKHARYCFYVTGHTIIYNIC